jgi:hypothetical protein
MTVLTATTKAGPYAGAGTTGPFSVPFRFLENAHLRVIKTSTAGVDADLVLTADYTVTGAGAASGSVTLVAPLAVGEKLTVIRNVPATQEADYVPGDAFPAESHEVALDKLTMLVQQQGEEIGRSLRMAPSVAGASTVLPAPQSNRVIAWNEAATALQNLTPSDFATIVAFGTSQADQFVGNGTTTDFTLSFFPGALANLDVSVDGATYVPGVDYTWASGQTLTFTVAPLAGQEILARYMRALPQGSADAAAVSYLPSGTGAVATNVQSKLREFVSVLDFGADPTGNSDSSAAINALISFLATNGDGVNSAIQEIYFPVGRYRLDNPIDLTTDNTHFHSRFVLRGSGWQTVLIGETGVQMVDFVGSFQNMIQDMRLVAGTTNPSTIGVFFHRGADTTQCIYHRLSNVYMDMRSNPAANSGVGTVGIWNVEGENHSYHNVYINANRAMVMTKYPTGLAYTPTSYVSLYTTQISCGSNVVSGNSMFIGWDRHFPPVYLDGVTHCDLGSAYINNAISPYSVTPGTYNFGIEVKDAFQLKHFALVEGVNQYMRLTKSLIDADLNIEIPSLAATSLPIIDMTPVNANTVILNSKIQILNNDTTRVFAVTADKNATYTSQVRCTEITGFNIFPRLPQALAFGSSEYSIKSESNRVTAGLRTLRREIEQRNVTNGGVGTPQNLFALLLPVAASGTNAGALVAKVEGTIFTSGDVNRTRAPAQLTFTSYVDAGQTDAGVISVGTPTTTVNSTFNPNPATASINSVTVSTSLTGTQLVVRIVFGVSGTNTLDNAVFFQGKLEVSWTGYRDEAPQIN